MTATIYPLSPGCYDNATSDTVTVPDITGVAQIETANSISVYPNPFGDFLFIKGLQENDRVTVFDRDGRKMTDIMAVNTPQTVQRILLNSLTPGLYFVCVWDKDGNEKTKLTVTKL